MKWVTSAAAAQTQGIPLPAFDVAGRRVPFDDRKVHAEVSGVGTLAAFGTGRPVTEENYTKGEFTSHLGRLLAIVRSGYEDGEAVLKVQIDGLGEARAVVKVNK